MLWVERGVSVMVCSINRWFALGLVAALAAAPASARDRAKPSHPATSPGDWFRDDDYPPAARRTNQQGRVVVDIAINELGKPTGCKVTTSSASDAFDEKTCELVLTRGKFIAAIDGKGKPIASNYTISTRWALQLDTPTLLTGPWRMAGVLRIDESGKVISCRYESSGSIPVGGDKNNCPATSTMPLKFGLFARGGATVGPVDVTMESSLAFDGQPASPMAYEADNREIVGLRVIHFQVDAAGKIQNCQVLAQSGPGNPNPCANPPGPFLPIAEPRGVTFRAAISRPSGG
jgi:TonB family protein